ncbi:formylglycine-generating enzyme family protein [Kangiella sediminilitoris]
MLTLTLITVSLALSGASETVLIQGGEYRPLYMSKDSPMQIVDSFELDKYPVTNGQFLSFVNEHTAWQRSNIASVFAEEDYLKHWDNDTSLGKISANSPVTNVSWFAADAYCQAQGKRLPKVSEWELAALASETQPNGSLENGYKQKILTWYSRPSPAVLPDIGLESSNYWGVHDMHGLVWEWTEDFNSTLVTGESREDSTIDTKLFCAGGASGAVDPGDYAAFMRYGFRSSLEAKFTLSNLGFRCASDVKIQSGE